MDPRPILTLPSGRKVRGHPPFDNRKLLEHVLSDELARQVDGLVEVVLPYGRADVATTKRIFEVEPLKNWRAGVRQVLAYAAQSELRPALALFGSKAHHTEVLKLYMKLRDGTPQVELWWRDGRYWRWISNRHECRNMKEGYKYEPPPPREPYKPTALELAAIAAHRRASPLEALFK
jgi:hypothetical protein